MSNRSVNQAQFASRNNFVTKSDLESASGRFRRAKEALGAAKKLSARSDQLVASAVQAAYEQYPRIAGEKAESTFSDEEKEDFSRKISELMRLVEYCLIVDGSEPMDDFLSGRREYYHALGHSISRYVAALNHIKNIHGLDRTEALETNSYIDYLIRGIS